MGETEEIRLPHRWSPRPYQAALWEYLRNGGTRAVECAHRRWGKDEVCLHHTACAAHERVGNYAHMLPEYAQARKAIWDAVNPHSGLRRIDEAFPDAIRAAVNDQEMKIRFTNGSTWQVVGSDNYNSLMGTSFAGIVKSEESLSNPSAWGYLAPILRENHGWCIFIGTPRGHNHFEDLLKTARAEQGWFAEVSPATATSVFTAEDLAEELRQLQALHGVDYGYAVWRQEYFCSFDAAIPGAIWADCVDRAERDGRIVDFDTVAGTRVYTAWDLGRTDDTAIWWYTMRGHELDVLDHFAAPGMDILNPEHPSKSLVHILQERRDQRGWVYGTHWLPHDARPRTLAAGGKSILQQFMDATHADRLLGRFSIGPRLDRQEGIQAARATFPRCRFHRTRTEQGMKSLRAYHRAWDDEKKMFLDVPVHNWASHDADAFRGLALSWKAVKEADAPVSLAEQLLRSNPAAQTMGTIRDRLFRRKRAEREWSMT